MKPATKKLLKTVHSRLVYEHFWPIDELRETNLLKMICLMKEIMETCIPSKVLEYHQLLASSGKCHKELSLLFCMVEPWKSFKRVKHKCILIFNIANISYSLFMIMVLDFLFLLFRHHRCMQKLRILHKG